MYRIFKKEIGDILIEKHDKMQDLIRRAIENNVHVDILVTSQAGEILAWEYFERLGFPKGTSEFTRVDTLLPQNSTSGHLRIPYDSVCCI